MRTVNMDYVVIAAPHPTPPKWKLDRKLTQVPSPTIKLGNLKFPQHK